MASTGYPTLDPPQQDTSAPNVNNNPYQYQNTNPNPNLVPQNQNLNQNQYPNFVPQNLNQNQNPNPAFNQINYQNPFGHPNVNTNVNVQPPSYYPPTQYNNSGKDQAKNMIQRNMLLQHMSKNIKASGQGSTMCLTIINTIIGVLIAYIGIGVADYNNIRKAFLALSFHEITFPETFFIIMLKSRGDVCLTLLAGGVSLFSLGGVFAVFNFCASCFACCKVTCMAYIQACWTIIWTIVALSQTNGNCGGLNSLVVRNFSGIPHTTWPFYAAMALGSLMCVIANCCWSSNQAKAEQERRSLNLMAAMV